MKCVIPESAWPRVAGKQVDLQSWDAALNVVQKSLVEIAVANKLNSLEDDPLIAEAFRQCDQLRANKYLAVVRTNRDFAKKYAISPRTVTNWRKEGCPFENEQWAVFDSMAERRYAPADAKAKFGKQLSERRQKGFWTGMNAEVSHTCNSCEAAKSCLPRHRIKAAGLASRFSCAPVAKWL